MNANKSENRVKVYASNNYFYAAPLDEEGKEYMPYVVYLLIRDKVPGYAFVFFEQPLILNGKIHSYEARFITLRENGVEKTKCSLYILTPVSKTKKDYYVVNPDGTLATGISEELVNWIREYDGDLEIVANYNTTNATIVFYDKDKNTFYSVFDRLNVSVSTKKWPKLTGGSEKRTIIKGTAFNTLPTIVKYYEVTKNGCIKIGERYAKKREKPFATFSAFRHTLQISPMNVKAGPKMVKFNVNYYFFVIIKNRKIIEYKLYRREHPYAIFPRHDWKNTNETIERELMNKKKRPWKVIALHGQYSGVLQALIDYKGRVYYVQAPKIVYYYAKSEYIIENFARALPIMKVNDQYMIVADEVPENERRKVGKVYIKTQMMGKTIEAEDVGYALVLSTHSQNGYKPLAPLIYYDIQTHEKGYAFPPDDQLFPEQIGPETGTSKLIPWGEFIVYKNEIHPDAVDGTRHRSPRAYGYSAISVKYQKVFRHEGTGILLPDEKEVKKLVKNYDKYIKEIAYIPARDAYMIGLCMEYEGQEFWIVYSMDSYETYLIVPPIEIAFSLDEVDNEANTTVCRYALASTLTLSDINETVNITTRKHKYTIKEDYIFVKIDRENRVILQQYVKSEGVSAKGSSGPTIFFSVSTPSYVYDMKKCELWLTINGKKALRRFVLPLPRGYSFLRVYLEENDPHKPVIQVLDERNKIEYDIHCDGGKFRITENYSSFYVNDELEVFKTLYVLQKIGDYDEY